MKLSVTWFPLMVCACSLMPAQTSRTVAQLDFWNWTYVDAPASAEGIVVDPEDDEIWYLPSGSGLFITRDGGASWVQELQSSVLKGALAIDPLNPNRVYVGSGSSLYLSDDKGKSWTLARQSSEQIASVFVSPTDGSVIIGPRLSSAFSGIYRSI